MRRMCVLFSFLCFLVSSAQAGLLGTYYNLSSSHPDMETSVGIGFLPGMVEATLSGPAPTLTAYGSTLISQFDWWDNAYRVGSRIDSDADLQSNFAGSWFPAIVNTGLPNDPQDFAVHWSGQFYVASDQNYTYTMGSDDDSWLFIDNQLTLDLGGIHGITYTSENVFLSAGWHDINIFFAERHVVQSGFQLNFFSDLEPDPGVPEPATLLLLATGLAAGGVMKRRKADPR